jgi:hypothetical protein
VWFDRASHLARSINAGCITIDEATQELVATIQCAADVYALRRAAWDAETVLGSDALLSALLAASAHRVPLAGIRTS